MRTVTLVMLAAALSTTAVDAKEPKPDVGAGHVSWFDITTTDMAKAKDFYGKLFGWTFTSVGGAGELAAEIVVGKSSIGTLRKAEGKYSKFSGVVYIQVNDMVAACKKAQALGGSVEEGFPFNLEGNGGAVGLATDPLGHPFGMYSRTPLPTAPPPPTTAPTK